MKKITLFALIIAVLIAAASLTPLYAATLTGSDIILFEDFEYDPAAYVMGQNFCYGPGDDENDPQVSAPTGTFENRGLY